MRPLKLVHALPVRRVAFRMAVIALAHPEEVRGEVAGSPVSVLTASMVQRLFALDQLAGTIWCR